MQPRTYQAEAINRVFQDLDRARSTLVVLPTGTGKTIVFACVIQRWLDENPGKRALVIAHREELIFQAADKIERVTNESPAVEMGELKADGTFEVARVVVSTVQTLNAGPVCKKCRGTAVYPPPSEVPEGLETLWQPESIEEASAMRGREKCNACMGGRVCRMLRFPVEQFGLVVIDEAHHSPAVSYRRVVERFSQAKLVGVTATPDRHDEEALGQVFESVAYVYEIVNAIDDGYLVPIDQQLVRVEGLDFSSCRTTAGDLNQGDLEKAMMPAADVDKSKSELSQEDLEAIQREEKLLHAIVDPTIQIAGDRPTLIFTASVAHAERVSEIINRWRKDAAVCIHGKTDSEERRHNLRRYKQGEFQFLVNCGIFLEGFDETRISVVAVARPTKSRALYSQMIGRGTRPLDGLVDGDHHDSLSRKEAVAISSKSALLVLDFVGNSGRHKLMTCADILGGNYSDDVVEMAKAQIAKQSAAGEPSDALKEIIKAQKAAEETERKRRQQILARASYKTQSINPFDALDITPQREPGWHKGRKPTIGQLNWIKKSGVPFNAETLTFWEASQICTKLSERI